MKISPLPIPDVTFTREDLRQIHSLIGRFRHSRNIDLFREATSRLKKYYESLGSHVIGIHIGGYVHVSGMLSDLRPLWRLVDIKEAGIQVDQRVSFKGTSGTVLGLTRLNHVMLRLDRDKRPLVQVVPEFVVVLTTCATCGQSFPRSIPQATHTSGCAVEVLQVDGKLVGTGHYGSRLFDGDTLDFTDAEVKPKVGWNCDNCIQAAFNSCGTRILQRLI